MNLSYRFDPRAGVEYLEAISWYGEHSDVAVANFKKAVFDKIESILSSPRQYRIGRRSFREAIVHKFPYSIIYFIEEEIPQIVITSIFHHSRNPRTKFKRF